MRLSTPRLVVAVAVAVGTCAAAGSAGAPAGGAATTKTLPAQMSCNARASVSARVQNRSRTAWPDSSPMTLHANDDARALGSPSVIVRTGHGAVRTGWFASFTLRLTAPKTAVLLWPSWRLYRGKVATGLTIAGPIQIFCDRGSGIDRKVLAGYQGWFSCPGDGAPPGTWVHWFSGQVSDADHAGFDLWPDTSELTPGERCPTAMTLANGSNAVVYSSANATTIDRHAEWMEQYGIDGVLYQRFTTTLQDPALAANRDLVLSHLLEAAARHGRKVAIEWDVTGANPADIPDVISRDWRHLVDDLHVTSSPAYLYDHGRPLVGVWGLGFSHVFATPAQAGRIITSFHDAGAPRFMARVIGGVAGRWRELENDAQSDPAWADVYAKFDAILPWTVGWQSDDAGSDWVRKNFVELDLDLTRSRGQDYVPLVFPGFSWQNLWRNRGETWPLNQVPRRGGRFMWHQAWNLVDAGATAIFVAMFDEVDEGTAIFKATPTRAGLPTQGTFLALDADGEALPSDWYLQVTREIGRMLRGEISVQHDLPIRPAGSATR